MKSQSFPVPLKFILRHPNPDQPVQRHLYRGSS